MRRRNRQGRIRTAEDLFFKIVISLVLATVVAGALALALSDDSRPKPAPTHTAATEEKAPRRVPTVGITAPPPTTTTTTRPAGPTPAEILAFTTAVDQAKARTADAFARLLALGGGPAKPAVSAPPAADVGAPPSPPTTAPPTTPTAATTTSTTTIVPVTTTATVPTTTTTRRRGKP